MFGARDITAVCIAAHPDDEVLFCGGTLARHARAGHRVATLILGAGLDARGKAEADVHAALLSAATEAARRLGAPAPRCLDFADNRFDTVPLLELIRAVEAFIAETKPSVIYTHHRGDLNIDHRCAHDAVLTACRPLPGASVRRILCGETPSSTEWQAPTYRPFRPTIYCDIASTIDAKVSALEAYAGEIRAFPHPRSADGVRALAALRGAESGFAAAEAFELARELL